MSCQRTVAILSSVVVVPLLAEPATSIPAGSAATGTAAGGAAGHSPQLLTANIRSLR